MNQYADELIMQVSLNMHLAVRKNVEELPGLLDYSLTTALHFSYKKLLF